MEGFKFWIISLCGAMSVSAIFKLLLSDSKFKKVINVFFSVFILFYTVIPVKALLKSYSQNKFSDTKLYYDSYYQEGYQAVIEQSVKNVLSEIDVRVLDIEISAYIDEEGYLVVKEITVKTDSESHSTIKEKIKSELGFEVTVQ